jgi:hypothetical protein
MIKSKKVQPHVIASPKGVAISSISGLRSLFRAKRGISGFASALPRDRFTPRNDKLLNAFVLIDVKNKRGDELSTHRPQFQTQNA